MCSSNMTILRFPCASVTQYLLKYVQTKHFFPVYLVQPTLCEKHKIKQIQRDYTEHSTYFLLLCGEILFLSIFKFYFIMYLFIYWAGDNFLLGGLHIPTYVFGKTFTHSCFMQNKWFIQNEIVDFSHPNICWKSNCQAHTVQEVPAVHCR